MATATQTVQLSENTLKSDFSIFTSIRYDPFLASSDENARCASRMKCCLYLPELHRQRLWKAAYRFWPTKKFRELDSTSSFEEALLDAIQQREMLHETFISPMKVKFTLSPTGRASVELTPVPAKSMEALFPSTFRLPSENRAHRTKSAGRFSPASHSPSLVASRFSPAPHSPGYSSRSAFSRPTSRSTFESRGDSTEEDDCSSSSDSFSLRSSLKSDLPSTLDIFVDLQPTAQTPFTSYKTTCRDVYNAARTRALPDPADYSQEVLLWNEAGQITEGSIMTPYFYRGGRWITPAVDAAGHGGQQGTSRRWALAKGLCEEGAVERASIEAGERVWLSNGVQGFGWGRVRPYK